MSLLERLDADLKSALKVSDKLRVSVIRLLKSEAKNQQIAKGHELSDEEVRSVIVTMAKQRRESIELFLQGGRTDLAEQEKSELAVLQSYMPAQLSHEELDRIILEAIQESGAIDEKEIGKVMRILMPKTKGVADGKAVNNRVRELLQTAQR
jgi:uncharacterized protein YqeY